MAKVTGLNDIQIKEIKHFEYNTKEWLLQLFNNYRVSKQIPKIWWKVITIPSKNHQIPKGTGRSPYYVTYTKCLDE